MDIDQQDSSNTTNPPGSPIMNTAERTGNSSTTFLSPASSRLKPPASESTTWSDIHLWDTASEGSHVIDSASETSQINGTRSESKGSPNGVPSPYRGPFPRGPHEASPLGLPRKRNIDESNEVLMDDDQSVLDDSDPNHEGVHILRQVSNRNPLGNPIRITGARKPMGSSNLSNRLFLARVRSHDPSPRNHSQYFVPYSSLVNILDMETVQAELISETGMGASDAFQYAKKICEEVKVKRCSDNVVMVRSYRPIFAMLVLERKLNSMTSFIKEEVTNISLPLIGVEDDQDRLVTLLRNSFEGGGHLTCFSDWSLPEMDSFERLQWQFCAQVFAPTQYKDIQIYDLEDKRILPFTRPEPPKSGCPSDDLSMESKGGFSDVIFMCSVQPEFHSFGRDMAIKRLKHNCEESLFRREVGTLIRFCGEREHPHVVPLLGAYRQFGRYHLIFPRAQSDLYGYWTRYSPPPHMGHDFVEWIAQQCSGLSGGLKRLHQHTTQGKGAGDPEVGAQGACQFVLFENADADKSDERPTTRRRLSTLTAPSFHTGTDGKLSSHKPDLEERSKSVSAELRSTPDESLSNGLHGDVKPENILWFRGESAGDRGHLKWADFGEAEINPAVSGSRERANAAVTMAYRAPECDLRPSKVRPASDLWSFGCVLLELATWMLGGFALVETFAKSRQEKRYDIFYHMKTDSFFDFAIGQSGHLGVRVKPEVTEYIYHLRSLQQCTGYIHELLDLIEDKLLVVDPYERLQADIHSILKNMYTRCSEDRQYSEGPNGRLGNIPRRVGVLMELNDHDIEEEPARLISYNMQYIKPHEGETGEYIGSGKKDGVKWKQRNNSFDILKVVRHGS